jgi:hypothetical protein
MGLKRLLFFLFIIIVPVAMPAQGNKQVFIQKKEWSRYSKGYDFTEKIKEITTNKKQHNFSSFHSVPLGGAWLKYVLWGLVIAILLVLIIVLIVNVFKGVKEKVVDNKSFKTLQFDDIEEANLEHFLDQSLTEGSFKEAIRIRYLMLIRTLSRLELIVWKKDKTNGVYINEMYGKQGFDLFRNVTINFERVWYGEKEIDEQEYNSIIPVFEQLNKIVVPGE